MSRIYDFAVVGVIISIAVIIHYISIVLFQPGSSLFYIATDGTSNVNGTAHANLWFEIIAIYVPLLSIAGIITWALIREYRRQVVTTARRPAR